MKVPKTGGTNHVTLATKQAFPAGIAVYATHVCCANQGISSPGNIMRVTKP